MSATPVSPALVPVITNAGLAACANAQGSGLQVNLSQLGFGLGVITNGVGAGYNPVATATALQSEQIRVPILSGADLSPAGFQILAQLPAGAIATAFIQEVGFYTDTGVLFALWSSPQFPLAAITALAGIDISFDLLLEQIPPGVLAVTVTAPEIPDIIGPIAELVAGQANMFVQVLRMQQALSANSK